MSISQSLETMELFETGLCDAIRCQKCIVVDKVSLAAFNLDLDGSIAESCPEENYLSGATQSDVYRLWEMAAPCSTGLQRLLRLSLYSVPRDVLEEEMVREVNFQHLNYDKQYFKDTEYVYNEPFEENGCDEDERSLDWFGDGVNEAVMYDGGSAEAGGDTRDVMDVDGEEDDSGDEGKYLNLT